MRTVSGGIIMKKAFKYSLSFLLSAILLFSVGIPAFAASGKWIKSGSRWWYKHTDGTYTKNDWEKIDGKWYHFDYKGWMQTGWIMVRNGWYYLSPNGSMKTGWLKDNGKWYFLTKKGYRLEDVKETINEKTYFFDKLGVMQTGWIHIGGWYYCNKDGSMKTGWLKDNGKWYYLSEEEETNIYPSRHGLMYSNGSYQINGKYYIFSKSGALAENTGWIKLENKWYFAYPDGTAIEYGWYLINGKKYMFYSNGKMATGIISENGDVYFLDENGQIVTGWVSPETSQLDQWTYFDEDGKEHIGWLEYKGKTYYIFGGMYTGLHLIEDDVYYFDDSGAMQIGEIAIDESGMLGTASFGEDGKMVSGNLKMNLRDEYFKVHVDYSSPTDSKRLYTEDEGNINQLVGYINTLHSTDRQIADKSSGLYSVTLVSKTFIKINDKFGYDKWNFYGITVYAEEGLMKVNGIYFEIDKSEFESIINKFQVMENSF